MSVIAPQPIIVLVRPQMAENVGAVARAMLNCGLTQLRLVEPREEWRSDKAVAMASGAESVLVKANSYPDLQSAVADLNHVYAATARRRELTKKILTPKTATAQVSDLLNKGEACGILFGPERTGLLNAEVAECTAIIEVPLNPGFTSLNLAQAVLIIAYEWFQQKIDAKGEEFVTNNSPIATREELANFLDRLENAMDECGFLWPPDKRETMLHNIKAQFSRNNLTQQEINTLHGMIVTLRHPRARGPRKITKTKT
ncbi:MAG: RNA methyltransferase [Alphaproteobacteria bacterium]